MNIKWNYKKCCEEAKKYETKFDFRNQSSGAYRASWKNKWLKDFYWLRNKEYKFDKEKKEYCIYSYELVSKNKVYVGLTNNIKRRDKQHRYGIKSSSGIKYSHLYLTAKNECVDIPLPTIIKTELTSGEAQIEEKKYIDKYESEGWEIINIAKTGYGVSSLGRALIKWNEHECFKEAQKYNKKSDFKKYSSGAYASSVKNGWYENYSWFGEDKNNNVHKRGYWNYDTCYNEALKYTSKKEFEKKSETAAKKAWENKWMDDYTWFINNKKPKNYWTFEKCLEAAKSCKNKTEFARKYDCAYKKSKKNNWFDKIWIKK